MALRISGQTEKRQSKDRRIKYLMHIISKVPCKTRRNRKIRMNIFEDYFEDFTLTVKRNNHIYTFGALCKNVFPQKVVYRDNALKGIV